MCNLSFLVTYSIYISNERISSNTTTHSFNINFPRDLVANLTFFRLQLYLGYFLPKALLSSHVICEYTTKIVKFNSFP